jgi:hypothetical protein
MMTTTISTRTMTTAAVHLPGATCLYLTMTRDAAGQAEALSLSLAWTDPIRPFGGSIEIPAHLTGELIGALQALEIGR